MQINKSNGHNPWGNMGGGQKGHSQPSGDSFEDWLDQKVKGAGKYYKSRFPGSFKSGRGLILAGVAIIVVWLLTGFYRVEQGSLGIELIFGKQWGALSQPGLNYNLPSPVGDVIVTNVDVSRKTEVGYQELGRGSTSNRRNIPEESLMLTSDQNIVDIEFVVFWKIKDPIAYIFNIRDPIGNVKTASESSMREVVGQTRFDSIVTEEKTLVSIKVQKVLQDFLDTLNMGILIEKVDFQKTEPPEQVIDAFNDVQRARQDLDRLINEAEAYSNKILPKARGESEALVREAEGYRESLIKQAEGEALRYSQIYASYLVSPTVTRKRMYLEAISEILSKSKRIIVDIDKGSGILPLLPLDGLSNSKKLGN